MNVPMRRILRCDPSYKHEKGRICDDGRRSWEVQRLRDMQKEKERSKSSEGFIFTVHRTVVTSPSHTDGASVRPATSCLWPMP